MKARIIAYYLPQFHPIPENDKWWGKGFTEWTNVGKAKPLFRGHYQPRVPADLGYYDLRLPEIKEQQALMAKEAGIEGFCYWHYWFEEGKELLEKPFKDVLESGKPDFPFCLGWANHSWTNKTWTKLNKTTKESMLAEQKYNGIEEHKKHFYELLGAFKDKRYIKVDDKPLFVVFSPKSIPNVKEFIKLWNELAIENGLKGIHFVGITENFEIRQTDAEGKENFKLNSNTNNAGLYYNSILELGFNAVNSRGMNRAQLKNESNSLIYYFKKFLDVKLNIQILKKYDYKKIIKHLYASEDSWENVYPTIIPNWDRSARSGKKAVIWHESTPALFKENIEECIDLIKNKDEEHRVIFLQSWNEWAEGNYVEPDLKFGKGYLNALKDSLVSKV